MPVWYVWGAMGFTGGAAVPTDKQSYLGIIPTSTNQYRFSNFCFCLISCLGIKRQNQQIANVWQKQ